MEPTENSLVIKICPFCPMLCSMFSSGQQPQSVLTQVSSVSDGNYTENRFGFQHQTVTPDNLYIVFVYRRNTPMLRLKVLEDMSVA